MNEPGRWQAAEYSGESFFTLEVHPCFQERVGGAVFGTKSLNFIGQWQFFCVKKRFAFDPNP